MNMTNIFLSRQKQVLTALSLWFIPENYRVPYLIYRYIQVVVQYSFFIFNIVYIASVWGDLLQVTESSYLLFTQATVCLKITTFLMNKNQLEELLGCMESDTLAPLSETQQRLLSEKSRTIWRVYSSYMVCGLINGTQWLLFPLFDSGPKRFPNQIWMPVDPEKVPDYYIGYVYQMYALYMSATLYVTIDYITLSMVLFASVQLQLAADQVDTIKSVPLNSGQNTQEMNDLIKENNNILNDSIKRHQTVIRFIELIENMFNVNIFFQLSGTVIIICIVGFRMTLEPPNSMHFLSNLTYWMAMLVQLYVYCWCGNELTHRSQVLRDTLYMSPWHEQDQRFGKTLRIAMECMKRPIVFKAGYYIPLSRPTFVSILRCSYSYFAVLNQANN